MEDVHPMPQMIAALFENRAAAEQALQALLGSGVARDRIALIGERADREVSSISGFRDLARDDDLAALHDLPLPEEDSRTFETGLRNGCSLIAARVDREQMDEAIRVIDMFEPLDLDRRSAAWQRSDHDQERSPSGSAIGGPLGAGLTGGATAGQTNTAAVPGMGTMTDSTHDVGSADLRTDETSTSDLGLSSTTATGHRREEERAGRPGVLELGGQSATSTGRSDRYRREPGRAGRVRTYQSD
jgi:hypothetical protein